MSRSPLYERVESVLAGDIADGSLPPETQLPSEDGLVERFKVSRTTVRKAIQNLAERGLIEVRRGKGTFVATTLPWHPGRWWSGSGVFAWPTVWPCLSTRHISRASEGRKVAENDLEAEPVWLPKIASGLAQMPRWAILSLGCLTS